MLGRICKIALVPLLLSIPVLASAAISQLSFTTDPQTVAPSTISGTLTVQLQDAGGASNPASETMDVEFFSTSATGEFLSPSSENPVTTTISTGSANKNFRYRDLTEGVFTLTVKATGRVSSGSWTATQTMIISNATSTTTSTTSSSTASSTPTTTASIAAGNNVYYVYYASAPLSATETKKPPQLSAGLNRLATAGSPLEFKVETDIPYLKTSAFTWNFGDGSEGKGEVLTHTYQYPGDYVVVLNADLPQGRAVSRVSVKVVLPDLSIVSASSDRIEIRNNSASEVSLFGRALWVGGKSFVFPKDSIILAGKNVFIPSAVTNLHPQSSNEVAMTVIDELQSDKIAKSLEDGRKAEVEVLQARLENLQVQLAALPRAGVTVSPTSPGGAVSEAATTSTETIAESQTASAVKSDWLTTLKRFLLGPK